MFLTHEKKVNHPNMVNVIGFVHGLDQLDMMLEGAYYLLYFLRRNIILWAFFHYYTNLRKFALTDSVTS